LIAIFKQQYLNGDKLTVVSPGTQTRNFTYIDDVVKGIDLVGRYGTGDGYGIGSNEQFSILEIAKMFDTKIEFLPERPGNRFGADLMTSKIKKLGWSAKTSVRDHILNFINNN